MTIDQQGERSAHAPGKVLSEAADGVGRIAFNQSEKRNAMSVEMWDGLTSILGAWRDDPAVRVVVLTGAARLGIVYGPGAVSRLISLVGQALPCYTG